MSWELAERITVALLLLGGPLAYAVGYRHGAKDTERQRTREREEERT